MIGAAPWIVLSWTFLNYVDLFWEKILFFPFPFHQLYPAFNFGHLHQVFHFSLTAAMQSVPSSKDALNSFPRNFFFRPRWHARRQVVRPHLSLSNTRQKWVTLSNTEQHSAKVGTNLRYATQREVGAWTGFVRLCHSPLFILGSLNLNL